MDDLVNEILTGWRTVYTDVPEFPLVICRGLMGFEKVISNIHYNRALKEAEGLGLPSEAELLVELGKNGDWLPAHEKTMKEADERIKFIGNELPSLKYRIAEKNAKLRILKGLKDKCAELRSRKSFLLSNSRESYAQEYRYYWNIHKITFDLSGKPIWAAQEDFEGADRDVVFGVISAYIKNFALDVATIRKIARSGIWRIYFNSCKNSHDLFNKPLCDLDTNQINVLYWSHVYDNSFNCMEPPSDEVIENDDLFDAWQDFYIEKQKKSRAEADVGGFKEGKSGKLSKQQMFVMTDDQGAGKLYQDFGKPEIGG